jgi:putative ABC transport system permease protein
VSTLDLIRYSLGAIRGHRLRTWLSLLGVGIGVSSVIILTSLGEGARLYVTGEFASLGSNLVILVPGRTETFGTAPFMNTAPNDLTVDDAEAILREVRGVRRTAPLTLGGAPLEVEGKRRDVLVMGTTSDLLGVRKLDIGVGRFLPPGVRDAAICVIGSKVQRELFGNENPLGRIVRVGDTRFQVIGVLKPRGMSIGMDLDEVVQIPVDTALRMFNRTSLFRILIEVGSSAGIPAVKDRVVSLMEERHGEKDVTVLTQDAVLSTFSNIFRLLTAALAGIAAISLTVAGIGIMNVMLVSVSERTREIGLLKAVGVTARQVLAVFLVEAAVISTAGGLGGLAAGLGVGAVLQRIKPEFPMQPPAWAVVSALAVSIFVGILFGLLPARRAARLDPVAALMRQRA